MKNENIPPEEDQKKLRLIGIFMTIPFVLAVPPILGWFIGSWIDKKLDTSFLAYLFILLGLVAGIREFIRIIKTYGNGI